jgi:hypothetical protein
LLTTFARIGVTCPGAKAAYSPISKSISRATGGCRKPGGALAFRFRIDMQDNSRHLAPVSPRPLRIEHPNVGDGVLFILSGQLVAIGREIRDVWI